MDPLLGCKMSNEEKDKSDNPEMGLGDHIALHHKELLEKNPLAISVALIISMMHLNSVPFSELVSSVIVCYVVSFYVVPALCRLNWSTTEGSDAAENLRQRMISPISIDAQRNAKHKTGFNPLDMTNPQNFTNPMSPLYQSPIDRKKR